MIILSDELILVILPQADETEAPGRALKAATVVAAAGTLVAQLTVMSVGQIMVIWPKVLPTNNTRKVMEKRI